MIKEVIAKYENNKKNIIPILLEVQKNNDQNFVSKEEIKELAKEMKISESEIFSIITFYSAISEEPRGKYIIQICNTISCHINGSTNVVEIFEKLLNISMGETTSDSLFTLEYSSCLGCCDISPAIRINEETYGNLTEEKIIDIIAKYRGDIVE